MQKEAKYLIRFDDICPTMNRLAWDQLKVFLFNNQIKPIIAVVPDNMDPDLMINEAATDFWDEIGECQKNGWKIALHGYNHLFVNRNAGIVGRTPRSEFAGVEKDVQKRSISKGIEIFKSHGINSDLWIAPAHSFDKNTLAILKEYGYKYVSDGFSRMPFNAYGFLWIPCQQWERIGLRKNGIYTVCIHLNKYNQDNIDALIDNLSENKERIISFEEAVGGKVPLVRNTFLRISSTFNGRLYNLKRKLLHIVRK